MMSTFLKAETGTPELKTPKAPHVAPTSTQRRPSGDPGVRTREIHFTVTGPFPVEKGCIRIERHEG